MTAERFDYFGKKNIIVGIKFDGHAKELLNWAVMKVAGRGDCVLAINICRHSGCFSDERALLDTYLEEYGGLCKEKQIALCGQVLKGNSIRKVLVREAKNYAASVVIVGVTKLSAFGGWTSVAKYCSKRLPPTTEVIAIYNGKVVFSSFSNLQLQGPVSCLTKNTTTVDKNRSKSGEFEMFENRMSSFDEKGVEGISNLVREHKRFSSLVSFPVEDLRNQKPGWPLLQAASSKAQLSKDARKMSVVQWVMSLPRRSLSLSEFPELDSPARRKGGFLERENGKTKELELMLEKIKSTGCRVFDYDVIRVLTSEFSSGNLIGKGGCNSVYKGFLPGEGKPVAVKVLKSTKESIKDFIIEIDIITSLKHKGITPLLGICMKDDELISIYDFLSKGSLEQNLHGDGIGKGNLLSWEVRFRIAVGTAEALNYLHNECPKPVIHRDVKSSNILLTEELEPQLCDFGLAMWGPTSTSFLMDSDVVGTFGYLAPEYFMYGKVSDKIDVYAFGVVILELLSGRKAIGLEATKARESLVMWAKPKLESGGLKSLLDPCLDGECDEAQMERMALAAKLCLSQAARHRPNMEKILSILNGEEYEEGATALCEEDEDDEVYPDSHAESHLGLALLDDGNDNSTSFSSIDRSSPLCGVEEYLKGRWAPPTSEFLE